MRVRIVWSNDSSDVVLLYRNITVHGIIHAQRIARRAAPVGAVEASIVIHRREYHKPIIVAVNQQERLF